jgi:hypothetical protein
MTSRKDAEKSLVDLTDDVGKPDRLVMEQLNSPDSTPNLSKKRDECA